MHVIATAGHVDHGKSTLVRALTGIEPDRLEEEQRRGLTVDLGYAWTTLPGDRTVAFVDVPGHERFISSMLAGVGPVPAVLFVVAADAGWSAQSAEHLQALDALGVRHGVLAVTRADLGDAEMAEAEARDYLAGTTLREIEAVAVSPVAGTGLRTLQAALARMVGAIPAAPTGRTRLWVDRVFTIHGSGTVVTGTLSAGSIVARERLQLHPSGEIVQVRGMQSLQAEVQRADAVSRVAINLRGVPRAHVHRGDTLTRPGEWRGVPVLDVRVGEGGRLPAQMIFHIGSAAVPAHVRSLGGDTARLILDRPVVTALGERGLLRDPGARRILPAHVLDPAPPPLTRRGAARHRAEELARMDGGADVAEEVRRRGAVRQDELRLIGVTEAVVAAPPGTIAAADWLVAEERWRGWGVRLPEVIDDWAEGHPDQPGMTPAAIAEALTLPAAELVEPLLCEIDDLVLDREGVHRRGRNATLGPEAAAAVEQIRERLVRDPFNAPELPEIEASGLTDRDLAMAVAEGRLLRVTERVYLLPDALERAVDRLSLFAEPFTMAQAREALGTTRRIAVPLLELLDRRRRTRRIDDQRREIVRR